MIFECFGLTVSFILFVFLVFLIVVSGMPPAINNFDTGTRITHHEHITYEHPWAEYNADDLWRNLMILTELHFAKHKIEGSQHQLGET